MSLSRFVRSSAVALLALFVQGAFAQPLKEVDANEDIRLYPGEARTFEFSEPVERIGIAVDGIAQITPQTDRIFTFQGISSGKVLAEAYAPNGHLINRMRIVVLGQRVKIHRWPDVEHDITYSCTDVGCDRVDAGASKAGSTSLPPTQPGREGGSVTDQSNP